MAKDEKAPAVEVEAAVHNVEIELLHPIAHNGVLFGRGIHKLGADLAKLFLSFKDPVSKKPIAQIPKPAEIVKGTVTVTEDAGKKKQEKS